MTIAVATLVAFAVSSACAWLFVKVRARLKTDLPVETEYKPQQKPGVLVHLREAIGDGDDAA